MAVNPLSKIPTLVREDGSVLFDSVVICEYLDTLAGGVLFPAEGDARWQALRWHALGACATHPEFDGGRQHLAQLAEQWTHLAS